MGSMDFLINDIVVGTVLNYKHLPEAQKIISKALDGTVYGQSTGKATQKYEVDIYCSTGSKRNAIDSASNDCSEVTMVLRDGITSIIGIIEDETISWKEWVDGHAVGKFTLVEV